MGRSNNFQEHIKNLIGQNELKVAKRSFDLKAYFTTEENKGIFEVEIYQSQKDPEWKTFFRFLKKRKKLPLLGGWGWGHLKVTTSYNRRGGGSQKNGISSYVIKVRSLRYRKSIEVDLLTAKLFFWNDPKTKTSSMLIYSFYF